MPVRVEFVGGPLCGALHTVVKTDDGEVIMPYVVNGMTFPHVRYRKSSQLGPCRTAGVVAEHYEYVGPV